MALDYSKLSDAELTAIADDDYSKLSDATLQAISKDPAASTPKEMPITTFLSKAANSAFLGLPEYLEKKFEPESYARNQQAMAGNPMASKYGEMAGDVAGVFIPAGGGAIKGAQIGSRLFEAGAKRFAPELATGMMSNITKAVGRAQGAATGGMMGAQLGVAAPEIMQSNPAQAVAKSELINQYANQIPFTSPLGGVTGHVVPAVAGALANYQLPGYTQLKEGYNRLTAPNPQQSAPQQPPVSQQPPTASNYLERMFQISKEFGL